MYLLYHIGLSGKTFDWEANMSTIAPSKDIKCLAVLSFRTPFLREKKKKDYLYVNKTMFTYLT